MKIVKNEEEIKKVKATISLDSDIMAEIDELAKSARLTRSNMIQNLVEASLPLAKTFERFRLLSFGAMIRDDAPRFVKHFRKAIKEKESEFNEKDVTE